MADNELFKDCAYHLGWTAQEALDNGLEEVHKGANEIIDYWLVYIAETSEQAWTWEYMFDKGQDDYAKQKGGEEE